MRRKIALVIVGVLAVLVVWQWELVSYGWMQARGQVRILWNTKPVAQVLADPAYPDSLKKKIELIREIKRFAIDSLGLDKSGSYESFTIRKENQFCGLLRPPNRINSLQSSGIFL